MDYDLAIIRLDSIMPTEFGQPLRRCTKDYYDSGYDMIVAGLGAINHHNANNRRILPDILIETKALFYLFHFFFHSGFSTQPPVSSEMRLRFKNNPK